MATELLGGHTSDLSPRDKEHLGGFGGGGSFQGDDVGRLFKIAYGGRKLFPPMKTGKSSLFRAIARRYKGPGAL